VALCKRGVDQSAEQSFAARLVVERPAGRGEEQTPALVTQKLQKLWDAAELARNPLEERLLPAARADAPTEALAAELAEASPEPNRQAFPSGARSSQGSESEPQATESRPVLLTQRWVLPVAVQRAGWSEPPG